MSGTIIPFKRQLIPFFNREMRLKPFLLLTLIQIIICNDEKPNIIYILADDLGYGGLYMDTINGEGYFCRGVTFVDSS